MGSHLSASRLSQLFSVLSVGILIAGCAQGVPSEDDAGGLSGEVLFESLVDFERLLASSEKFYGGISFRGGSAASDNLVVYLLEESKEDFARSALQKAFGENHAAEVEFRVWEEDKTSASPALKGELTSQLIGGKALISVDYEEPKDRVSLGISDLSVVNEIEQSLQNQGIEREAIIIRAARPVTTY
jgi:hypothetical protein